MKKELIAFKDPKSPVSEVFRTLRTNIQFMGAKGLKTLLVTSTLPGEGKSWISSNLAVTFAQAGKRVILIDADMRKGRQYSIFNVVPKPGLSNYLSGIDENGRENNEHILNYVRETEVENLYLIPAGNIPPNPSELLVSARMIEMIEELKNVCDLIIFDGTPVQLVTDSIIISRFVDSTIIVTAHKETKKDNLARVKRSIENVGGKVAGVVFNKVPVSSRKYEDTYYYGNTSLKTVPTSGKTKISPQQSIEKKIEPNLYTEPNKIETPNHYVENRGTQELKNQQLENKNTIQPQEVRKPEQTKYSEEKTEDILREINRYLDEEKSKLNHGHQ